MAGVKRLGQRRRQQAAQIGRRAEFVDAMHLEQMLVFDLVVVVAPPAAPAVARIAPLFDLDEQHFERQPAMRKDAREVDQLFEHIEQRSLLRAAAARDDLATCALALHQVLADDDRLHDEHAMLFQQRGDLVANRRQRRELNFDQLSGRDDIDAIAAEPLLDERRRRRSAPSIGGGVWFPYVSGIVALVGDSSEGLQLRLNSENRGW